MRNRRARVDGGVARLRCDRDRRCATCDRESGGEGARAPGRRSLPRRRCARAGALRRTVEHGARLWRVDVFDDDDRARYVESLRAAIEPGGRYFMLCFSDQQPGAAGPRRVSQDEIRASFAGGGRVDSIEASVIETNWQDRRARAWLAACTRT